jgi:hypothetical protein
MKKQLLLALVALTTTQIFSIPSKDDLKGLEFSQNIVRGLVCGPLAEFALQSPVMIETLYKGIRGIPQKNLSIFSRTLTRIPNGTITTMGILAPLLIERAKMGITTTDKQWRSLQLNDQF